jgi:transcriptional regulator of acetoin/glycerol metabolism
MSRENMSARGRKKPVTIPADYKTLEQVVQVAEKKHIQKTIELMNWNLQQTCRVLDIVRNTLKAKIKKYGIK